VALGVGVLLLEVVGEAVLFSVSVRDGLHKRVVLPMDLEKSSEAQT
jgi:hypothetical protein